MKFVLHPSVSARWLLKDTDTEAQAYAEKVLVSLIDNEAIVPSNWWLDMGDVIATAERDGLCSLAETERFAELLGRLPISECAMPGPRLMQKALTLARQNDLSVSQASYIVLANVEDAPIALVNKGFPVPCKTAVLQAINFPLAKPCPLREPSPRYST